MTIFERLYLAGYSIKKRYKLNNRKKLPCKVISIGNITLGGTGKTPAAIALAQKACGNGLRPCILTRGYRGTAKGPCFVGTGDGPLLDENRAGDEAYLMALKLKGIPIIKGKDRYEAGIFALNNLPADSRPDLFILDDGFQHWGLCRDNDILLIDGTNPFGNGKLFPVGSLREPVSGISRADMIVITKTEGSRDLKTDGVLEEIRKYNKKAPVFFAVHKPSRFIAVNGESFPLEWAKGKVFFGFCGIGNPRSFQHTLASAGAELTGLRTFRDHYYYGQKDIKTIVDEAGERNAGWIVTTEKDIMRLKGFVLPENLASLEIEFDVEEKFYHKVFTEIQNKKD
jgi:tetraacyldisaccharide 4'-kinase